MSVMRLLVVRLRLAVRRAVGRGSMLLVVVRGSRLLVVCRGLLRRRR
jgi:hypothetical protein